MSFQMRPLLPRNKRMVNPEMLDQRIANALVQTVLEATKDFQATTTSWDNRPTFQRSNVRLAGGELAAKVFTWDLIYAFVSLGTKPHPIRARLKPMLVFNWFGYGHDVAKTAPRWIGSRPAGPQGPIFRTKEVWHPGTVAREYPQVISQLRLPGLVSRVRTAIADSIWQ